jgi:hypothetical protein
MDGDEDAADSFQNFSGDNKLWYFILNSQFRCMFTVSHCAIVAFVYFQSVCFSLRALEHGPSLLQRRLSFFITEFKN